MTEAADTLWPTGESREIRSHRRAAQSSGPGKAAEAKPESRGRRVATAAGVGGLTLAVAAMAAAGYLAFFTGTARERVPIPSGALPPIAPAPSDLIPPPMAPAAPSAAAPSPALPKKQVAASATPTEGAGRARTKPPPAAAPTKTKVTYTRPGLVTTGRPTRSGEIVGPGGLCLDLRDNMAVDGNQVQVFECNGTSAQEWTVTSDGTLRVGGKCAQSSGGSVTVGDCDGRDATGWRAGRTGTLVNEATGTCLTGTSEGLTPVRVSTCGDSGQRWTLP